MPAHFAAAPRGGNTLGLLAPDPRQEPTAPAPVTVKSKSKACLRRLSPARRRERRGKSAPALPCGGLGSLHAHQGPVASPLRGCRPRQGLDPHSARKAHQGAPAQSEEQSKSSPKGKEVISERCRRQATREPGGACETGDQLQAIASELRTSRCSG